MKNKTFSRKTSFEYNFFLFEIPLTIQINYINIERDKKNGIKLK